VSGAGLAECPGSLLIASFVLYHRYYFLVAFASYVNASKTAVFSHRFAVWLRNRAEIWNNILRIRSKSMQLVSIQPTWASDLS
jgi:hypothetical protein